MLYRVQIFKGENFINQTELTTHNRALALARSWVVDDKNRIAWRPSDDNQS